MPLIRVPMTDAELLRLIEARRVAEGQLLRATFVANKLADDDIRACNLRMADGERRYGSGQRFIIGFRSIQETWEELLDGVNLTATAYANGDLPRADAEKIEEHLCEAIKLLRKHNPGLQYVPKARPEK